jgi:Spy/CpxP family protein refolding chaperone
MFPNKRRTLLAALVLTTLALAPLRLNATAGAAPEAGPPLLTAFRDYLDDLNLSPDQRDEMKAVFRSHSTRLFVLAQQEAQSRKTLQAAIHRVPPDPVAISRASATVAAVDQALALERARIHSQIYPILTPEQRDLTAAFLETARSQVESRFLAAKDRIQEAIESGKPLPLLSRLNLSPSQKDSLKALYQEHQPIVANLLADERTARAALIHAIRQPTVDEPAVIRASAAVAAVDADLAQERARIWTSASAILTPEQRAQIQDGRARIQKITQAVVKGFFAFFVDLMS